MLTFSLDHFRRQIFGSPAKLLVFRTVIIVAGKAEVCKLSLALSTEEDVLWLYVLVDDVLGLEAPHRLDHFAQVLRGFYW